MITNKDEAFHHNACKKLAQLSKVIFAMNCMKQDQVDEKSDINSQFEQLLNDLKVSHQEKLNDMIDLLFKFRKHSINKSCSDFGSLYKRLKKDFIDLFREQNDRFIQISDNIKNTQKEIKSYQVSSLQMAASFFENTDKISNELKKLKKAELSPLLIKSSTDPIYKKIDLFNKEWKTHIIETKKNHQSNVIQLEEDYHFLTQKEIKDYYTIWNDLLLKFSPIKEDISHYKSKYDSIQNDHASFSKSQFSLRNQIVNETTQALLEISKQKKILTQSLQANNSNNSLLIRQLEQKRKSNNIIYSQIQAKLKQEIHQQQHLRHQLQKSFPSRDEKLQSELNHNFNLLNQKFLNEKDNLLELQSNHRKCIIQGLQNSQRLLQKTSSLIKKSLDNENFNVSKMTVKIRQMQTDQNSSCENYKSSYQAVIDEQTEKLQNCLQKIFSLNEFKEKETEKVEKLNSLLHSKSLEMKNEIESLDNKVQLEYQSAADNYQKLQLNKIETNNSIFSQKIERKKNFLNQISQKFNDDLTALLKSINDKNDASINDQKNAFKLTLLQFDELQNHEIDLSKINGRLQFFNQAVEQAKQIAEKTVGQLERDISLIDKKMRKFKRSVKSTIQNLNQEYEVKIQVLQIDLNNKIENLSKLYSKEENDRGCEIIEAIRKIREAQNQQLNKSLLLTNEKEHLVSEFERQKKEKEQIINDLLNSKKENQLKEKIDFLKAKLKTVIETENKKLNDEINRIKTSISTSKSENEKKLEVINNDMLSENNEFDKKCKEILIERDAILEKTKSQISQKDIEFEKTVQTIKNDHQKEIESLKKRIEFAKKIQKAEIAKYDKEIDEKNKKCKVEIDNLKSSQNFNTKNNDSDSIFENKFIQILNRQMNLYQLFLIKEDESQSTQSKRLNLEFQSVQKTSDLSSEFSNHFKKILNCSKSGRLYISHSKSEDKRISFNLTENANVPNENKDENNDCIRSQLFKRLSQNNRGGISESHSHKKMPTLVTPRLV